MAQYSKRKIEAAGKILVGEKIPDSGIVDPLDVVDFWRSAHSTPMLSMEQIIKKCTDSVHGVEIFSRLKRKSSIISKLKRYAGPTYNLREMDDIAGCRIICKNISDMNQIYSNLKQDSSMHKIKDYVKQPKRDGYRSIHLLCRHDSKIKELGKLRVETQIRTELQHAWAVIVEIYDLISHSSIKNGGGSQKEKECLRLISQLIALKERTTLIDGVNDNKSEIINRIKELDKELCFFGKIMAFHDSVQLVEDETEINFKDVEYFLIDFDYDQNQLKIKTFNSEYAHFATEIYDKKEREVSEYGDILLVKASSIEDLKFGYPNYFSNLFNYVKIIMSLIY